MTIGKQTLPKDDAAQALLHAARALLKKDDERRFFDILFAGAASEDIDPKQRGGLGGIGAHGLGRGAQAQGRRDQIAILPGSNAQDPENVVVAVNDDRPFLFDSAAGRGDRRGARIRAAFHPILDMAGKPTSVIVLVLDAMAGETAAGACATVRAPASRKAALRCATGRPCWRG